MAVSQRRAKTCLIVTTIVFSLGAVLSLLPAITSVFLFDAPGSEKNRATIVLFCSALTLPVACVVAVAGSWIFYVMKKFRAACWFAFLPLVNVACGAAAAIWLEIFNGGRFS
jgi:hypothetical protein